MHSLPYRIAEWVICLSIPVIIIMTSVRLIMTPLFLQIEYTRPGFPSDIYGFTTTERLQYAPYALNYLLNSEDIGYLGDLRFPEGGALFNTRELHHMRDVKIVTQFAFTLTIILVFVTLICVIYLRRKHPSRLWNASYYGGIYTITLLIIIVLFAVFGWDYFFTLFHDLLFAEGTWQFLYSDTLIRLFPEQFWFDAALTIGVFSILCALGLIFLSRRFLHAASFDTTPPK
jgi:integral membrane protein (TIGR01906 family)